MKFCSGLFFLLVVIGCTKERPQPKMPTPVLPKTYSKVYVLNQGIWPNNNSSITLYDETQGVVSDNYFSLKNPNAILGSVPQSITKIGNKYFVVVNNASKVIALDSGFINTGEIMGLLSPRYMLSVAANKAYVTDMNADVIHIINPQTLQKTGSIACKGWCEQLLAIDDNVYVTNYKKNQLYILNSTTNTIVDSIEIEKGAETIVKDKNNNLWVMCTSIYNYEKKFLFCINPSKKIIVKKLEFALADFPSAMQINSNRDEIYYINKHVFKMKITDANLPTHFLIDGNNKSFYGLGVNPKNETIYVSDSKGGATNSKVYIHKNTGEKNTTFDAGYFAGYFYFDK